MKNKQYFTFCAVSGKTMSTKVGSKIKKSTGSNEGVQWVILHKTSTRDKLLGLAQFNDDYSPFML